MQHKKIFPLFFLFLLLSVLAVSLIPQVKATDYEWIQNPSFEDGNSNIILNSGFELGNTNYWTGSWLSASTTYHYTGFYSGKSDYATTGYLQQNFTDVLGTEIQEASIYYLHSTTGTITYLIRVYYNDSSYNDDSVALGGGTNGVWTKQDFTSYINDAKYVNAVRFTCSAGAGVFYIDDFVLDLGGTGQIDFDSDTLPWWASQNWDFQGISFGTFHTGYCSAYLGYEDQQKQIVQDIGFLDSDFITGVGLYAKAQSTDNSTVRFLVIYSDRTNTYKDLKVNNTEDWKLLSFTGFILPNKIIIQIQINVISGAESSYVNIDDVSLLASVPYGQTRFSWLLSPTPISATNLTFSAYQLIDYVFTGYVYNNSGYAVDDGTFITTSTKGTQTGNINNGVFTFSIIARNSQTDFEESIIIVMSTTDTFTVQIVAHWVFVSSGGGDGGDGNYDSWYSNMVVTYMVLFIFIIVPPLIIAFEFSKHDVDPFMGFIGGLCLTVPIAYIVHIIDLWVLFVFVLGLILMILAKLGALSRF